MSQQLIAASVEEYQARFFPEYVANLPKAKARIQQLADERARREAEAAEKAAADRLFMQRAVEETLASVAEAAAAKQYEADREKKRLEKLATRPQREARRRERREARNQTSAKTGK